MLVFFYVLFIILAISLIIYFSSIRIEIEKIKIDTTKNSIINDYKIKIYLAFLNKINYLRISIYKEKIEKIKNLDIDKIKEKVINLKIFRGLIENGLIRNTDTIFKTIKTTNIKMEKFILNAKVGLDNIVILSFFVSIVDIIMSIFLSRRTIIQCDYKEKMQDFTYNIIPKQTETFYLTADLSAIFSIKISNIIKKSCNIKKIKV